MKLTATFATFAALLSQCILSSASPTALATAPASTSTAKLNTLAKSRGKLYFGTATDNPELTDVPYVAILDDNTMFGQITAANSMKWDATEPALGDFTFQQADVIANLAKTNGQLLRGHNCVWHNQLPSWVSNSGFNAATLTSVLQTHVSTLVVPFDSLSWDVVNAADPNAKLYINEFNIEFPGAKSTAMQNLVKSLKASGTPIDGIGLQSHFIVGEVPSEAVLIQNMEAFTALGVEVAITELDIRMTLPSTPALLAQQKTDYDTVVSACIAVARCVGITIWDFTDKFSFVPGAFPGQGAACPWDQNLVRKPAFDGIVIGLST
ncbi:hypothetical protein EW026_g2156 [Hermanssonia centrifuga]|uniref:Beta-xylanase n=1 Tax=Hermanssonia centrifuga TaxID=98765 RepID=A0A4S4KPV9_9APHY|nr:hypothetical protein EW026_g2156 [Hermanssonia centrifuga]